MEENSRQACYGCLKKVTVNDVVIPNYLIASRPCPILMFGKVRAVLCEGPMCAEEIKEEILAHDSDLSVLYTKRDSFKVLLSSCVTFVGCLVSVGTFGAGAPGV